MLPWLLLAFSAPVVAQSLTPKIAVCYAQALADAGAQELLWPKPEKQPSDPTSALTWLSLGVVLERDSFGRLWTGDWQPQGAAKALRKSLDLSDRERAVLNELAREAIDLYQQVLANSASLQQADAAS